MVNVHLNRNISFEAMAYLGKYDFSDTLFVVFLVIFVTLKTCVYVFSGRLIKSTKCVFNNLLDSVMTFQH